MALQITQGTQTTVYTKTNAGTEIQVVKLDIGSGTNVADFGGTFTEVTNIANLAKGTLSALAAGTLTGGTLGNLNYGTITIDSAPVKIGTSYGTLGTAGAATWTTLVAASGAGTKQYVSGVDVVVASGTVDIAVTNIGIGGSTGAGVLARGQFTPGGGISKNFNPVMASGTNGTLSFWMGGAGTVAITIQYWQGV